MYSPALGRFLQTDPIGTTDRSEPVCVCEEQSGEFHGF
ncbi:hypothetical protein [Paraburkholderia sp. D1E]